MTNAIFNQEPYLKQLNTRIKSIEGDWIELEETIFYPNGGGQPGDRGEVHCNDKKLAIIDTRKGSSAGVILHQLETENHDLCIGSEVSLYLDWPRRYRHMRMHTSLHLLCSLIPKGVTGGSVGELKSRLDFDLGDHTVDKEGLTDAINKLIEQNLDVSTQWITDQELDSNPELVRTMSVQPPRGLGKVRMVRVDGVDYQPCGGTHVANTGEIGRLKIGKIENKGKRNRRIHLLLDDQA